VRKKGQSNEGCAPKKDHSSGLSVFLTFQVLAVPEIGNSAAKAVAHADFVSLSMYRNAQLSVQTRDWIERWSGLVTDSKSALSLAARSTWNENVARPHPHWIIYAR
jgi:hypothetical protein